MGQVRHGSATNTLYVGVLASLIGMSLALVAGQTPMDLTEAWQSLCQNQFHDILTGTSISEVFDEARIDFDRITSAGGGAATRGRAWQQAGAV